MVPQPAGDHHPQGSPTRSALQPEAYSRESRSKNADRGVETSSWTPTDWSSLSHKRIGPGTEASAAGSSRRSTYSRAPAPSLTTKDLWITRPAMAESDITSKRRYMARRHHRES